MATTAYPQDGAKNSFSGDVLELQCLVPRWVDRFVLHCRLALVVVVGLQVCLPPQRKLSMNRMLRAMKQPGNEKSIFKVPIRTLAMVNWTVIAPLSRPVGLAYGDGRRERERETQ